MVPLTHLRQRAAIKQYNSAKKVSEEDIAMLVEASNLAPTSFGVQPIKLYVVENQDVKKELRAAAYDQPQLTDASHIFVYAAKKTVTEEDVTEFISRVMDQRKVEHKDVAAYEQMIVGSLAGRSPEALHTWAAKQAYISMSFAMVVAAENKIDTTPMEGFSAEQFATILNTDDEGYFPAVILAVGYRSEDDHYSKMPKVRKSLTEFAQYVR